jgi:hypothetical protein
MMTSRSLICLLENQNGSKLQKIFYFILSGRCSITLHYPFESDRLVITVSETVFNVRFDLYK